MKKILLSVFLVVSIGFYNQSRAQCSGANTVITNFFAIPNSNAVVYGFDWEYVQGNASIEVAFLCNGVQVGSLPCMPRLKDSTAGVHHVGGTFNMSCSGVIRVEIRIWTNNSCGGTNCIVFRDVSQSTLPVNIASFTANRNHAEVLLKWETIWEQNCRGFAIERNTNGTWEEVAFVNSLAPGGNSSDHSYYQYTDINNNKGMSQYRLRQVDFDDKSKFSEIRLVRADGQDRKIVVYPNPSMDGKVNISFDDDLGVRDVSLTDMNGRIIKQWKAVTYNNITIVNLKPGMYMLRILWRATGEQTVEKISVNKQ